MWWARGTMRLTNIRVQMRWRKGYISWCWPRMEKTCYVLSWWVWIKCFTVMAPLRSVSSGRRKKESSTLGLSLCGIFPKLLNGQNAYKKLYTTTKYAVVLHNYHQGLLLLSYSSHHLFLIRYEAKHNSVFGRTWKPKGKWHNLYVMWPKCC